MKKNKKIILTISIISLIIVSLFLIKLTEYPKEVKYFVTESGVITFTSQPIRWVDRFLDIFKPVKQAQFQRTTAYVGESVLMEDTIPANYNGLTIKKVNFAIYKDGQRWGIYNTDWKNLAVAQRVSATFIAQQPGKYTSATELIHCSSAFDKEFMTFTTYVGGLTMNTLTVVEKSSACNKNPYWTSWTTSQTITGGVIQKRIYYEYDSNCNEKKVAEEFRTVCDSGYVISGTTSSTASGSKSCERIQQEQPKEEKPITIQPITEPTPTPECSADVTDKCSDGKTIVLQYCQDGKLVPTNNKCENIKEEKKDFSFIEENKQALIYSGVALIGIFTLLIIYNLIRRFRKI